MFLGMGRYHQDLKIAAPYCTAVYTAVYTPRRCKIMLPFPEAGTTTLKCRGATFKALQ